MTTLNDDVNKLIIGDKDIDNYFKVVFDCLQKSKLIKNDS